MIEQELGLRFARSCYHWKENVYFFVENLMQINSISSLIFRKYPKFVRNEIKSVLKLNVHSKSSEF